MIMSAKVRSPIIFVLKSTNTSSMNCIEKYMPNQRRRISLEFNDSLIVISKIVLLFIFNKFLFFNLFDFLFAGIKPKKKCLLFII